MSLTDFWISPPGLREMSGSFDNWAEIARSAITWIDQHPVEGDAEHPLYARGATAADELCGALVPWFQHLDSVLTGIGAELRDVADEADAIDLDEAARLDAIDPTEYNDFDPGAPGRGSAAEILPETERLDRLAFFASSPPGGGIAQYCDLGSYEYLNESVASLVPSDLLSPSEWIETVLTWIGGMDIGERILQTFGGRWSEMFEFRDTVQGLSTLLRDMHDTLSYDIEMIGIHYWQGYAANSAQEYFSEFLAALSAASGELQQATDSFTAYCTGVEQAIAAIDGQIHAFADSIIFAAVAAAIGTGTIETGIGPILGYGSAALAVWRATVLLKEVRDALQDAMDIADVLEAIGNLASDLTAHISDIRVPQMEET